ncbi:MAG: pitrilysin family protein [Deltaproteobacteria bacterium]|nr:pitrilysin family protein [Deltaproteobacteria bacterium]
MRRFVLMTALAAGACATGGAPGFNSETAPLVAEPQPKLFVPRFTQHSLQNGAKVFIGQDQTLPAVSVVMAFHGGLLEEPASDAGKTALMLHTMIERSARLDRKQLGGAFDDTCVPQVQLMADGFVIQATVLLDRLEAFFTVAAEFVQRPEFGAAAIDMPRAVLLSRLSWRSADPDLIATDVLQRVVFGEQHRLAVPLEGTPATVAHLSPSVLEDWHHHVVRPERMTIVLSGRIGEGDALPLLQKAWGKWKGIGDTPGPVRAGGVLDATSAPKRTMVYGVARPGLSQTIVRVGRKGLPAAQVDRPVLEVLNMIASGRASAQLRTLEGATYGVMPFYQAHAESALFGASTAVDAKFTKDAVNALLSSYAAVQGIRSFSSDWLAAISTQLLWYENRDDFTIAGRSLALAFRGQVGMPTDYIAGLHEHVAALRSAEFELLAERYFDDGALQIVLVGDPKAIETAVSGMSFTKLKWVQ